MPAIIERKGRRPEQAASASGLLRRRELADRRDEAVVGGQAVRSQRRGRRAGRRCLQSCARNAAVEGWVWREGGGRIHDKRQTCAMLAISHWRKRQVRG